MSEKDFGEVLGRYDERLNSMEEKIDDLKAEASKNFTEIANKVDAIRAPKMWPIIGGVVMLIGFIGGANTMWVNMRLKPMEEALVRAQKDFDRLYDDQRDLKKVADSKADKVYVDDKISYAYDRLKTEIRLKQQTP